MSGDGLAERNARMAEMRQQGLTLDEIGKQFGITREAVRLVLRKMDGPSAADARAARQAQQQAAEARTRRLLRDAIETNPGSTVSQIASIAGVDEQTVRSLLPRDLRRLIIHDSHGPDRAWSDEAILEALTTAATYE